MIAYIAAEVDCFANGLSLRPSVAEGPHPTNDRAMLEILLERRYTPRPMSSRELDSVEAKTPYSTRRDAREDSRYKIRSEPSGRPFALTSEVTS